MYQGDVTSMQWRPVQKVARYKRCSSQQVPPTSELLLYRLCGIGGREWSFQEYSGRDYPEKRRTVREIVLRRAIRITYLSYINYLPDQEWYILCDE